MIKPKLTPLVLLYLLISAGPLPAQEFEGTIRQRSLTLSEDALYEVLWAAEDEETEYESEGAYNKAMALFLFDLSQEELDGLVESGRADLGDVSVHIRGTRIRTDGGPDGAFSLIDLDSGTMWMVDSAKRTYLELSKADLEEAQSKVEEMLAGFGLDVDAVAEAGGGERGGGAISVVSLDEIRTINGFEVQGLRASSDEEFGEAWCAKDMFGLAGSLAELAEKMNALDEEGQGRALEDVMCPEGLPALTKTFYPYGALYEIAEVLAIEAGPLAPEMFEVPDGYRRIDPSEFWR